MEFNGIIEIFTDSPVGYHSHIKIPEAIFAALASICVDKRVVCTINGNVTFHGAMMPKGSFHYILLNQEIIKKNKLQYNQEVFVQLEKDNSQYGIPMSEEMEEVLRSDPEGSLFFHQLTPGKQRTLIYSINKVKSSALKIERSFVIMEHLKKRKGNLDFKGLDADIKAFREMRKL